MATLKEYLEKVALKVGSRGAMPGTQTINYSGVSSFIAPADGWAHLSIRSEDENGWLKLGDGYLASTAQAPTGHNPDIFLPVKKGNAVSKNYAEGSAQNIFEFIKSVGGGLKSLIYKLFPEVRHAYA